jgi:predicted aspartyl protease
MCFINKKPASILIDGGASRNFISDHFIKKAGLKAERKKDSRLVILADGT